MMRKEVKDALRDSRWVSYAWDWFMVFLGRWCEPVLWFTLVFSVYTITPNARQPSTDFSNGVFVLQFIGLDIAAGGLYKLAQMLGEEKGRTVKRFANTLLVISIATVIYAGVLHMFPGIPKTIEYIFNSALVIVRATLTVLYAKMMRVTYTEQQIEQQKEQVTEQQKQEQNTQQNSKKNTRENIRTPRKRTPERTENVVSIDSKKERIQNVIREHPNASITEIMRIADVKSRSYVSTIRQEAKETFEMQEVL